MFSSRLFGVCLLRGKEKPIFFTGDADMNARAPITMAIVLVFAAAWYITTTIHQTTAKSPSGRVVVGSQAETETTAVRYGRLKAHVRETIRLVEDTAEQWNERNTMHLQTSLLGRNTRERIRAAMHKKAT